MPNTWDISLKKYRYPVDLKSFVYANKFNNFFSMQINGDRDATIKFENNFREKATDDIVAYAEVIYWKLFSQPLVRNGSTFNIIDYLMNNKINAKTLYNRVNEFILEPSRKNLKDLRKTFGITSPVLAVCLTFPAFIDPKNYPMVDKQIARWVNENYGIHSQNCINKLTPFKLNGTSLQDNDFETLY